MADSSLRTRLQAGETLLGCFLTWPVPGFAELVELAGFDFLVIDSEHGFFSIESIEACIRGAEGAGIPTVVRAPSFESDQVGRYLDAGAAGTLFPRIPGVGAARDALANVKFPPLGRRGLAGVRANRYGTEPLREFVERQNSHNLVAIQIETAGALAELGEIAALEGADVLFVGPNDLSQALGAPGVYDSPSYREAIERVAIESLGHGKAAGIMLQRPDQAATLSQLGYRFFTTSDRALVLDSARRWRAALPRPA